MQKPVTTAFALSALAAGILIGNLTHTSVRAAKPEPQVPGLAIPSPSELSTTFSSLAKRLEPSVVTITTSANVRLSQSSRGQNDEDDIGRRFFGDPFGGVPRQFRGRHLGSGVVVDPKGYIITNHHVVDRANRIQVKLANDQTEYEAKVIGSDPESDLAVIKIDAGRQLPAASIGNSDAVQVGEWAVAIGAPFGFDRTVTVGIISAKGRDLGDPEHPLTRFLQTDAAINQGNSGGPLLNVRGQVIGINAMIATDTGGYEGLGFAIPINMAAKVYNDIIRSGKVSRGALGIFFDPRGKPELLKAYGASEGVFVQSVTRGGPAEKAGMQVGDIIVAFEGQAVRNNDDLLARLGDATVGREAAVTVLRDGKKLDLRVTVADRAELNAAARPRRSRSGQDNLPEVPERQPVKVQFGMSIEELTPDPQRQLKLAEKTGILITSVDPASFAEDIGLREGDIITAMNRQPIRSIDDFKRLQTTLKPGDAVALRVMRSSSRGGADWQPFFAAGTLPNR
jgi:serine protease Do